QLPSLSADALECQPTGHLWNARALRGCGAEHADLRREWSGQIQGHRHHARSEEFRSVLAVRCAHVSRQWKGARNTSLADVWPAALTFLNVETNRVVMRERDGL